MDMLQPNPDEIKEHCREATHKSADAIKQTRSILIYQQSGEGEDALKSKVTRNRTAQSSFSLCRPFVCNILEHISRLKNCERFQVQ